MKRLPEFRCVARHCVNEEQTLITRPDLASDFWRNVITSATWYDPEKEVCAILVLNRKNRITAWNLISIGSAVAALVCAREVLRACLVAGGTAFVLMHSHPSGDPTPSAADVEITRRIREAAQLVEVSFQDHVIIGRPEFDPLGKGYYSFRDAGII